MEKKYDPGSLVDETGYQKAGSTYACMKCGKKENHSDLNEEEWAYRIKSPEEDLICLKEGSLSYAPLDTVDYICSAHLDELDNRDAEQYVELGLPYFLSRLNNEGGIYSF